MRLTLVILACLAVAGGIRGASVHKTSVDQDYLERQRFLCEMMYRVANPLMFEEWIKIGKELIVDKSMYNQYNHQMEYFYSIYKAGEVFPRGQFFGALGSSYHYYQGVGLYNFFLHAKDWTTLVHNIAWARIHVSEGMFVYALTLAVAHRPDMNDYVLPAIYEIFPQYFFPSTYIYRAEEFDQEVWSRQYTLYKELYGIHVKNYSVPVAGNYYPAKGLKTWQWYKLNGLGNHFYMEEKHILRDNMEEFLQNPMYKNLLTNVKAYYTPVDYTRDIYYFNDDTQLSYFTEDIGWNAYWYYLNMDYPINLGNKEASAVKSRHGEWWIYNVQQLLARYNAERLSHGLSELGELSYYGIVETGYDPQLVAYNGNGFSFRKNYFEVVSYQNFDLAHRIMDSEHRIMDIIDTGYYVTMDGMKIDLTKPEAIEYIGDLMQGNSDMLDSKFFGYWYIFVNIYMSGGDLYDYVLSPHSLMNFETMLRDPISYKIFKNVVDVFYKFYYKFEPYTHEELLMPGVEIQHVDVSKLTTFFDLYDADITNLLNDKLTFHDGKFVWDTSLFARQVRLNHEPFDFTLKVLAKKPQKVVVRSFYVPAVDEYGQKMEVIYKPDMFIMLDQFVVNLVEGENDIKRSSNDFYYNIHDQTTYTELYKYVMYAYENKQGYSSDIMQPYCGFPDRLVLPHGWEQGLPIKLFFILTPYNGETIEQQSLVCGLDNANVSYDNLPYGYPFDRKINSFVDFIVPNMYFMDTKIYHAGYHTSYDYAH